MKVTSLVFILMCVLFTFLYFTTPQFLIDPRVVMYQYETAKQQISITIEQKTLPQLVNKTVPKYTDKVCPEGIDVVWLWVNGSDPVFRQQYERSGKKSGEGRFRDYNTLQYSLRSVYEYAPYIKNYYIVTMDQIPSFINMSRLTYNDYKLRIVSHKEIFPDTSVLPIFNSNALEVSLHNIKNLSSCFLYLNDDMFLGNTLSPSHFIAQTGKLKIYANSWAAPDKERMQKNIWHRSVGYSNERVNAIFKQPPTKKHSYVSHHCYFFKTSILADLEKNLKKEYVKTRQSKFRHDDDMAVPFSHGAYAVESGNGTYIRESNYYYATFTGNRATNLKTINNIKNKKPQCVCLNDALDKATKDQIDKETIVLHTFLDQYLPRSSPFENEVSL
ncbi:hypothetical protein EIN_469670 [Entamoeba invadens IP1]|uniref:Glycosyltransferase n=2 Tax=Entamoeba invadens TaxID=33085 RepID=A0A0A1TWL9_ENTIV|nr:hypothetical protein EIN_469670 [Entamoeba invadens IP1]ELP83753.1 hypothetical protein EIN_469670 [Entamoeba invadens IP1]|eukprot:XP_004183099.1 hypothetical protein EIN_469670 [Entamoeba invadens IP1]